MAETENVGTTVATEETEKEQADKATEQKARSKSDRERARNLDEACDAICSKFNDHEVKRTAGAIQLGGLVQTALLDYIGPETSGKERSLRRKAALDVVSTKLTGISGAKVDAERTLLVCYHLHAIFGSEVKKLGIGACKALQPLIKRNRDDETWGVIADYKDKAEKLVSKAADDEMTAKEVAIKVAGILGAGSKSAEKDQSPEAVAKRARAQLKNRYQKAREAMVEAGLLKDKGERVRPGTPQAAMAEVVKLTTGKDGPEVWKLLGHNDNVGAKQVESFLQGALNARRVDVLSGVANAIKAISLSDDFKKLLAELTGNASGQGERKAS